MDMYGFGQQFPRDCDEPRMEAYLPESISRVILALLNKDLNYSDLCPDARKILVNCLNSFGSKLLAMGIKINNVQQEDQPTLVDIRRKKYISWEQDQNLKKDLASFHKKEEKRLVLHKNSFSKDGVNMEKFERARRLFSAYSFDPRAFIPRECILLEEAKSLVPTGRECICAPHCVFPRGELIPEKEEEEIPYVGKIKQLSFMELELFNPCSFSVQLEDVQITNIKNNIITRLRNIHPERMKNLLRCNL